MDAHALPSEVRPAQVVETMAPAPFFLGPKESNAGKSTRSSPHRRLNKRTKAPRALKQEMNPERECEKVQTGRIEKHRGRGGRRGRGRGRKLQALKERHAKCKPTDLAAWSTEELEKEIDRRTRQHRQSITPDAKDKHTSSNSPDTDAAASTSTIKYDQGVGPEYAAMLAFGRSIMEQDNARHTNLSYAEQRYVRQNTTWHNDLQVRSRPLGRGDAEERHE